VLLGNMTRQKYFIVEHSAALVAEVAVLSVHVNSQVLLAIQHVPTLVAPKSVLLHLVLFTLNLGCKCFSTFVTLCPTLVSLQLRIGLEAFVTFLALENRGWWFWSLFGLHRSWGSYSRSSGRRKAVWLHSRAWKRARSAARQQVLASYVRIELGPWQDDSAFGADHLLNWLLLRSWWTWRLLFVAG